MICYGIGSSEDKERLGICEDYEVLLGPDGFQCILTEPEDRTWNRDLKAVIFELNHLYCSLLEKEVAN